MSSAFATKAVSTSTSSLSSDRKLLIYPSEQMWTAPAAGKYETNERRWVSLVLGMMEPELSWIHYISKSLQRRIRTSDESDQQIPPTSSASLKRRKNRRV
jgi:hypothetical protein